MTKTHLTDEAMQMKEQFQMLQPQKKTKWLRDNPTQNKRHSLVQISGSYIPAAGFAKGS